MNEQEIKDFMDTLTYESAVYEAYASNFHLDLSEIADWYTDCDEAYYGDFDCEADFAMQVIEDSGIDTDSLPDLIKWHIDYDGVARDLLIDDFWGTNEYYFSNH